MKGVTWILVWGPAHKSMTRGDIYPAIHSLLTSLLPTPASVRRPGWATQFLSQFSPRGCRCGKKAGFFKDPCGMNLTLSILSHKKGVNPCLLGLTLG